MLHVCKHSNKLCRVIFVNSFNLFNNDVTCQHRKLQTGSRLPTGVFTPPTRRNSTVSSRRRRRCVVGLDTWYENVSFVGDQQASERSKGSDGETARSFVQRSACTYQDMPVHVKTLTVKLIRFERKDLIELKWVNVFFRCSAPPKIHNLYSVT